MGAEVVVVVGGDGLGEELAGLCDLAAGEAFLFELAVFFGELEVALGEGEAGADGHFIAGEALAERLDETVGTLVDLKFKGLGFVFDAVGNLHVVAVADGETVEGYRRELGRELVRGVADREGGFENAAVGFGLLDFVGS